MPVSHHHTPHTHTLRDAPPSLAITAAAAQIVAGVRADGAGSAAETLRGALAAVRHGAAGRQAGGGGGIRQDGLIGRGCWH